MDKETFYSVLIKSSEYKPRLRLHHTWGSARTYGQQGQRKPIALMLRANQSLFQLPTIEVVKNQWIKLFFLN